MRPPDPDSPRKLVLPQAWSECSHRWALARGRLRRGPLSCRALLLAGVVGFPEGGQSSRKGRESGSTPMQESLGTQTEVRMRT